MSEKERKRLQKKQEREQKKAEKKRLRMEKKKKAEPQEARDLADDISLSLDEDLTMDEDLSGQEAVQPKAPLKERLSMLLFGPEEEEGPTPEEIAKKEAKKAKKAENKTKASYEEFKQWQQVQALEKAKDDKARAKGGDAMANRVDKKARRELYTGPNGPVKPYIDDIKKIAKEEGVTMGVAQEIHKGRVARHMAEYYKSFNGRNTGDSADDIVIPF